MNIRFLYLAQLRTAAKTSGDTIPLNGPATVASALRELAEQRPELRALLLGEEGEPRRSLLIFVGENRLQFEDMLTSDTEVTLMTPIAGGNLSLSEEERARYEWQMWTPNFGEAGQLRLKGATVLISRIGGVGGAVAQQLAMAGVGRLIVAHAGNVRASDLNRQVLMTTPGLDEPRLQMAMRSLTALNPEVKLVGLPENMSDANADTWVARADVVVSAAPRFGERFALQRAAVRLGKPLVDAAMYDLTGQVLTVQPGVSACLGCLYPEEPNAWKREFPVFGAVAATIGSLAAVEVIKLLAGLGEPLTGRLLLFDFATMTSRRIPVTRDPACRLCGMLTGEESASP
jgi:molybdopterin/thiamine biosynthesis adenylyltransferase/molybdopterin converting factor small subunit